MSNLAPSPGAAKRIGRASERGSSIRRCRVAKKNSRAKLWQSSIERAKQQVSDLQSTLESLIELQGEFEEWRENMPDSLSESPTALKLDEVMELDIQTAIDGLSDLDSTLDEWSEADLPKGFGRD